MGKVPVGYQTAGETFSKLKNNLSEKYKLDSVKEIQHGIQCRLFCGENDIGILRIFESKKGTSLDLSQLKNEVIKQQVYASISNIFDIPTEGEFVLPKIYFLRDPEKIKKIQRAIKKTFSDRIKEFKPKRDVKYALKLNGCTIHQFKSGKLLIQGNPSSLSDELISIINKEIEDDVFESFLKIDTTKKRKITHAELKEHASRINIEPLVSERVYNFMFPNDQIEIKDALTIFALVKEREINLDNYVPIVRNFAIAYEGFLIKLFINLGLINEKGYVIDGREARVGTILNKFGKQSEFEEKWGHLFGRTKPFLGEKLDSYWKECRNKYLHSDPVSLAHIDNIKNAEAKTRELMCLMDDTFEVFEERLIEKSEDPEEVNATEVIGTDESGKGDYFGALVIAAVHVGKNEAQKLVLAGVRDSKDIHSEEIFRLEKLIKSTCKYDVVLVNPKKYNELYEKIKNLNKLLAWGHARALENMLDKIDCSIAVADQFGDESLIKDALMAKGKKIRLIQITKGERNIAVAAASVLARAEFLRSMERLSKEIKRPLPRGSSSPNVVATAKSIISNFDRDKLREVAKIHFKLTKQVLAD